MKSIYLFSGLGADQRVFEKLDFSGYNATFIQWIAPKKGESIEAYASRLCKQITTKDPILIGLSFGGVMAVEVAKQITTEKIILIASAKRKDELPFYYRLAGKFHLHQLLPLRLLKKSNFLTNWFFGAVSTADRLLLSQILEDTDPIFLKWAIDQLVRWKNQTKMEALYHIHGTQDRLLPIAFVNCDATIAGGGHLMTLNKAAEINAILSKQC